MEEDAMNAQLKLTNSYLINSLGKLYVQLPRRGEVEYYHFCVAATILKDCSVLPIFEWSQCYEKIFV